MEFVECMLNLACLDELFIPIQFLGFYDDDCDVYVLKLLMENC